MTHPLGNRQIGSGGAVNRKAQAGGNRMVTPGATCGSPSGLRPSWLERWDEEPNEEDLWRERGWI